MRRFLFAHDRLGASVEVVVQPGPGGALKPDSWGCFVPFKGKGKAAGRVYLRADIPDDETIIHEAFHAGLEAARRQGMRLYSEKGEERAVTFAANLAAALLKARQELYAPEALPAPEEPSGE